MKPRLTDWFPSTVKPVLKGVYERAVLRKTDRYSYWDGSYWGLSEISPEAAYRWRELRSSYQSRKWRGLAENPSAAPASHDTKGSRDE
jgi:hypothetical protein